MGGPTDNPQTFNEIVSGNAKYTRFGGYGFKGLANWITCADGTTLSVQASHTHYCAPRTDTGPYFEVEVGYPSVAPPDSWREFFDGDWDKGPTDSVYGYVPIELVREFIEAHGGEVTPEPQVTA